MKHPAIAGALGIALVVGGCAKILEIANDTCAAEARAHTVYMTFIAPLRSAEKVAKAVNFHAKTQQLCAAGASVAAIQKAAAEAESARQ